MDTIKSYSTRINIIIFILSVCILLNFDLFEKHKISKKKVGEIFSINNNKYLVCIKKKSFKLFIINRDMEIVKIFNIAVGKKEKFRPKVFQGDKGTPEGLYYIIEILSLDADKDTDAYRKLKRMNFIYFKASEGYYLWGQPDKDAGYNVYGVRFFRLSYPNEEDDDRYIKYRRKGLIPKNKDGQIKGQGTGIGIHGTNDPLSIGHRISSGCIRLFNEDVIVLNQYIQIGTPVFIEK